MKNNDLKEKIRKNIKEEIAISNIRKEFDIKTHRNKKIVYAISSMCAVFILGISIFFGTNKLSNNLIQDNKNIEIGKTENIIEKEEGSTSAKVNSSEEENLNEEENPNNSQLSEEVLNTEEQNVELNINKIKDLGMTSLDADIRTEETNELPEKCKFIENIIVPSGFNLEHSYNVFTRENDNDTKYNILHDYVFEYRKDDSHNIKIAFSEIEPPIRDYFIKDGENISKIGDIELKISQWEQMYIVTFKYKDMYFDIETTGVTEDELVTLLESIINNL